MRIKKRWIILPALLIAPFVAFKLMFPTYTHRYRLTVNIEADGKLFSGSSVIEVRRQSHGPLEGLIAGAYDTKILGAAALVDLGSRGIVLTALRPSQFVDHKFKPKPVHAAFLAYCAVYGDECEMGKARSIEQASLIQNIQGLLTLNEQNYPSLIWLEKPSRVDLAVPILAREMREKIGATFVSVTIEMTRDPPQLGDLSNKLPWFDAEVQRFKAGKTGLGMGPDGYELSVSELLAGLLDVKEDL